MAKFERIDLGLKEAYDELFMNDEERKENKLPKIYDVPLTEIDDFPDHPFKVKIDEDMEQLVESIKQRGVITPVTLREKEDGRYELISGHRRKKACEIAGLETIKAEIKELDRDEAIILMVESNLQRSTILPSEKAFSYKMRLDAMKRQAGRPNKNNSVPLAQNYDGKTSREILGEQVGESQDQIRRYIRLTNLTLELLELVDEGKIALRPAVELSYLTEKEQNQLNKLIEKYEATPSYTQAIVLRKHSTEGTLTDKVMEQIIKEQKPNQQEKLTFKASTIKKYIPKGYTDKQAEDFVIKALDFYKRHLDRQQDRGR